MRQRRIVILIVLILTTLLAGFLRFYKSTENPPSLNNDEVAYGYDAYSLLRTGRDQYGQFLPFIFKSVGDYKSPVLIYTIVPFVKLFGLNELGVRWSTNLTGMLSIPAIFWLIKELTKSSKLGLIASLLLAISPWHIYYSRFASDHLMATFFLIIGMYFFLKANTKICTILGAVFLAVSMYSYHSHKLFIPLFCLTYFLVNRKKLASLNSRIFLIVSLLLWLPLVWLSIFGQANARLGMVFLWQDIDYTRYTILDHFAKGWGISSENLLLVFFWLKRYLNYFQPNFLFSTGLNITLPGTLGLGVLHLFELPWLVVGIWQMVKQKPAFWKVCVFWILLGLIPASLTNNEQSAGRSLLIVPPVVLLISYGAWQTWVKLSKLPSLWVKNISIVCYGLFIAVMLIRAGLVLFVHFPLEKGEAFMEGAKQSLAYALANQDKYQEIVYDPRRGTEAGDIVNIPHMYWLFNSRLDPQTYQNQVRQVSSGTHIGNFTVRNINWSEDRKKNGILFIGSPWSLPAKDLKQEEIIDRIYLKNGRLVLVIATPHFTPKDK